MLDQESIHHMWSEDSLIFDNHIEWITVSWKDNYQTSLEYFYGNYTVTWIVAAKCHGWCLMVSNAFAKSMNIPKMVCPWFSALKALLLKFNRASEVPFLFMKTKLSPSVYTRGMQHNIIFYIRIIMINFFPSC